MSRYFFTFNVKYNRSKKLPTFLRSDWGLCILVLCVGYPLLHHGISPILKNIALPNYLNVYSSYV